MRIPLAFFRSQPPTRAQGFLLWASISRRVKQSRWARTPTKASFWPKDSTQVEGTASENTRSSLKKKKSDRGESHPGQLLWASQAHAGPHWACTVSGWPLAASPAVPLQVWAPAPLALFPAWVMMPVSAAVKRACLRLQPTSDLLWDIEHLTQPL